MPSDLTRDVTKVADAYRNAMARADRELGQGSLDHKILQAIVASSAAETTNWIQTRLPNGSTLALPLANLVPLFEKGNFIGQSLSSIQSTLLDQAKKLLKALLAGASTPLWLGSVASFLTALFLLSQSSGFLLGQAILPIFLASGAVGLYIIRGLTAAGSKIAQAGGNVWDRVERIGYPAQRIFEAEVIPTLNRSFGETGVRAATPILGQLRAYGKAAIAVPGAVMGACLIFFAIGVGQGLGIL